VRAATSPLPSKYTSTFVCVLGGVAMTGLGGLATVPPRDDRARETRVEFDALEQATKATTEPVPRTNRIVRISRSPPYS